MSARAFSPAPRHLLRLPSTHNPHHHHLPAASAPAAASRPPRCPHSSLRPVRPFSTSPTHRATPADTNDDDDPSPDRIRAPKAPTRHRRRLYGWLNGPGKAFLAPLPGSTNYLGAYSSTGQLRRADRRGGSDDGEDGGEDDAGDREGGAGNDGSKGGMDGEGEEGGEDGLPRERLSDLRPFPLNSNFVSQSVLSEELREIIYRRVEEKGEGVSAVSADLGVDMRRVAAVVRLKSVERRWTKEGKQLADSYASAVMDMLPQTKFESDVSKRFPHESINDLPVHPATQQQIFWPTSESRQFTREDAAKVFSPTLLPADKRIPHPELIEVSKEANKDLSQGERNKIADRHRKAAEKVKHEAEERRQQRERENTQVVAGPRWDFKFESISAEAAGRNGRNPGGVGWRYGMPHEDRKRGNLKGVPTAVET